GVLAASAAGSADGARGDDRDLQDIGPLVEEIDLGFRATPVDHQGQPVWLVEYRPGDRYTVTPGDPVDQEDHGRGDQYDDDERGHAPPQQTLTTPLGGIGAARRSRHQ